MFFKSLFNQFKQGTNPDILRRKLIRREAAIGSKLFGPIPKGRRRDFFYYDDNVWVWHEGWYDEKGREQITTTRYEIQPDRIIKIQDNQPYRIASDTEVRNLHNAAKEYYRLVTQQLYS